MFRKIALWLGIIIAACGLLLHFAMQEASTLHRDPVTLMNKYHILRADNPENAREALRVILNQNPDYEPALRTLSADYLASGQPEKALPLLEKLHTLHPGDTDITLKLGTVFHTLGMWEAAVPLLAQISREKEATQAMRALTLLQSMASFISPLQQTAQRETIQPPPPGLIQQLLARYWAIRGDDPDAAANLLRLLETVATDNPQVMGESGYEALRNRNRELALRRFLVAWSEGQDAGLAMQIAYLYLEQGKPADSAAFFLRALRFEDATSHDQALRGLEVATLQAAPGTPAASQPQGSPEQILMDQFYALQKRDKQAAWHLIQEIVRLYPANVPALKSAGYLAIVMKDNPKAIDYFTRAWTLTRDPALALQLGYLYDATSRRSLKPTAYSYFRLATASTDESIAFKAQNAMTNLGGLQTKGLPDPWFGEIFFDPFTQSRFGLTVRPLIARLGVEHDNYFHVKTYLAFRQTDDNKSRSLGQLPQIYEDNVRIIGSGVQLLPIPSIPLVAFVEGGAAYDLVYRFRDRWRPDLRGGVMYFNEFGAQPAWYRDMVVSTRYYSFAYGDITYFSRYRNNVIGTFKTHQGIRLLQYHSSMINLFWFGHLYQDTRREFFNNVAETGPGIGFIPTNRLNLELRYEHIRGVYLPTGSSFNPYSQYYTNNFLQMLVYAKI